jgi:hypothetical protein
VRQVGCWIGEALICLAGGCFLAFIFVVGVVVALVVNCWPGNSESKLKDV